MGVATSGEMLFVVFVAVLLAVIGIWFLIHSRSRRFGVNRYCAICDYPLRGLSEVARCPECGADLATPVAVAVGRNRSDDALFVAAIALIAPLMLVMVISLVQMLRASPSPSTAQIRGTGVRPYVSTPPASVSPQVKFERRFERLSDDALADKLIGNPSIPELQELLTEAIYRARLVSAQNAPSFPWITRLIDHALDAQADPSEEAFTGWATFIQSVEQTAQMSDAQWSRYLRQGVSITWILPNMTRIGAPLEIRYATSTRLSMLDMHRINCRVISLSIGDASTDDVLRDTPKSPMNFKTSAPFFSVIPGEEWAKVRPGPTVARVLVLLAGISGSPGANKDQLVRIERPIILAAPEDVASGHKRQ